MTKRTPFPTSPTTADDDQDHSSSPRPVDTAVNPQADQRFSSDGDDQSQDEKDEEPPVVGATDDGPKPEDAVPVPLEEAIDRGTRNWLTARLSNSPLSRATEAWNLLHQELPNLKAFIMKEVQ